eukprot:147173-Chlamydomonas_euryale.AAC.1
MAGLPPKQRVRHALRLRFVRHAACDVRVARPVHVVRLRVVQRACRATCHVRVERPVHGLRRCHPCWVIPWLPGVCALGACACPPQSTPRQAARTDRQAMDAAAGGFAVGAAQQGRMSWDECPNHGQQGTDLHVPEAAAGVQ